MTPRTLIPPPKTHNYFDRIEGRPNFYNRRSDAPTIGEIKHALNEVEALYARISQLPESIRKQLELHSLDMRENIAPFYIKLEEIRRNQEKIHLFKTALVGLGITVGGTFALRGCIGMAFKTFLQSYPTTFSPSALFWFGWDICKIPAAFTASLCGALGSVLTYINPDDQQIKIEDLQHHIKQIATELNTVETYLIKLQIALNDVPLTQTPALNTRPQSLP